MDDWTYLDYMPIPCVCLRFCIDNRYLTRQENNDTGLDNDYKGGYLLL